MHSSSKNLLLFRRCMLSFLTFISLNFSDILAQSKPNILWIVCEDISPMLSMYGDHTAKTPNLDALAKHSTIYDNAFATVSVCAPARSSIITGIQAISLGTMHMRTGKDITSYGSRKYKKQTDIKDVSGQSIIEYSAVPNPDVKCFTEYLRAAGYFCTNNQKTDYQFAAPISAWDINDQSAHWRLRPKDAPFFAVFNINDTHESKLWEHNDKPLTVDLKSVRVPPYMIDNATTRHDIARHYSNIELMDVQVGKIIQTLKEDGLYDQTVIFFYSDHGGPLPRQKRETNDRGLRVPLMIKNVNSKVSRHEKRLVSSTDLAPTMLSIAGQLIPKYMQGLDLLGKRTTKRKCIAASGDRFDEFTDRIRLIRTNEYVYIRNDFPDKASYLDIAYRKKIPSLDTLLSSRDQGLLNEVQMSWFLPKGKEILYHVATDPHNISNVIDDPKHRKAAKSMRKLFDQQYQKTVDLGKIPESALINKMWPNGAQSQTDKPDLLVSNDKIYVSCLTIGSSISYIEVDTLPSELSPTWRWQLYDQPIEVPKNKKLLFICERIGFKTSEMVLFDPKLVRNQ
jgi:N-sulfoglucosamine sulfohydrolase